jgi:hypothetical protein
VSAAGFQDLTATELLLEARQMLRIDVSLRVGQISATVNVEAPDDSGNFSIPGSIQSMSQFSLDGISITNVSGNQRHGRPAQRRRQPARPLHLRLAQARGMTALFADTFYWVALADFSDSAHQRALTFTAERAASAIITTDDHVTCSLGNVGDAQPGVESQILRPVHRACSRE